MKTHFKINEQPNKYTMFKFASGETQIELKDNYRYRERLIIEGSCQSADQIMELLLLVNAIRQQVSEIELVLKMPYIAYSRQDRPFDKQALAIQTFTQLINSCNFQTVITYDNHSDVTTALLERSFNVTKEHFLDMLDLEEYDYLVAPDAGAIKQVQILSNLYQIPMVRADKTRSLKTGDITGTEVYIEDLTDAKVLIVDDLCQGGRTFDELSKALKKKNCKTIHLYVTHGFFSNGLANMLNAGIEHFFTSESVCSILDPRVTIIKG